MNATLNLDSQFVFGTIEIQNVRPNSVLAAKFRTKGGLPQASPKKPLGRCGTVAQLLPERFLVRQIVDLFHGMLSHHPGPSGHPSWPGGAIIHPTS
jgi:hypothetical protein